MKLKRIYFSLVLLFALSGSCVFAAVVTVAVDHPGAQINPAMWGGFFEDINFGADGGLYVGMVKNASFEFPQPLMGWRIPAENAPTQRLAVLTESSDGGAKGHFLRLESSGESGAVDNEGFRGIGVKAGNTYDFSVEVRGAPGLALRVDLCAPSGAVMASARIKGWGSAWTERKAVLVGSHTEPRARLRLTLEGTGSADLDHVSLFPRKTWKQRPAGLRADMVQALADLGPGFLRFPGGCIVEGSRLELRYQWKKTIGPVESRPLLFNRWNAEFKHRPTPDYYQTFGLGFYEYFILCEDLGAEPLPILNCGMACQFNSGELVPLNQLDPYIQDALDLIDFANAPVDTPWGARRAELGHPAPFHMKMLGVGNEQWGPQYFERYTKFSETLRARHPEISLVAAAGPELDDERYKYAWPRLRQLKADIVDEHCYAKPEWFFDNAHRYDSYERNGPKVFMGEYAAQSVGVVSPDNKNTLRCALAEAAFMTGLERNADVVRMASYAPLFAHADAWQWTPNLIWVNNLQTLGTPSYHVQRLFARNRGDRVLPVTLNGMSPDEQKRLYSSAAFDDTTGEIILKLVNARSADTKSVIELTGVGHVYRGTLTVMHADDVESVNSFENPSQVAPTQTAFSPGGPNFELTLPANSFSVVRLGVAP